MSYGGSFVVNADVDILFLATNNDSRQMLFTSAFAVLIALAFVITFTSWICLKDT